MTREFGTLIKNIKSMPFSDTAPEKRILHLFLLLRLVMVGFFVALHSGYFIGESLEIDFSVRIFFFLVVLISISQLILLNRFSFIKILGGLQLSVDIILLTYVLALTQNTSSFSFYLILIICASLVTNSFSALLIAALSGICYALLMNGAFFLESGNKGDGVGAGQILISYFALICAALVSAMYAKGRERLHDSLQKQHQELKKVTTNQMQLMNSLAEGVITVDIHSAITGINDAAKAILGISSYEPDRIVGENITSALSSVGADSTQLMTALQSDGSCEMRIRGSENSESVLRCTSLNLHTDTAEDGGRVLFFSDVSELKNIESRLEFHEKMTRLFSELDRGETDDTISSSILIGKSVQMQEIHGIISKLGPSDAPALILGESGTGKEVVAKSLHASSHRNNKPFIPVNCGAIPESLIESELFGHVKGAFTGADREVIGLFREAEGGTLFLDEVGELPLHLQAKLLRVLQDKTVRPVGGLREIPINVRIIAATNRNLKEEVKAGTFREDLYYRLRVVEIPIPPLRSRRDDIPLLIAHFLDKDGFSPSDGSSVSPEALSLLMNYDYPGNIRELENILSRGRVLGGGAILPENLPDEVRYSETSSLSSLRKGREDPGSLSLKIKVPVQLEELLEGIEKEYLMEALSMSDGVKKEASRLLGLNFRSFRYRLKKYGIDFEDA
jgi:two-component system response regulator PilR (NtrC family)